MVHKRKCRMEKDNVIDNKITMILWHVFENYQVGSQKDIVFLFHYTICWWETYTWHK